MSNIDYLLKFDKEEPIEVSLQDIYKETFYFGFITYGGPLAHIGLFRKKFVEDLNWIDDKQFTELFALCSSLPGNI